MFKTSYHHPSNMLKTSYHHPSNKLKTIIKTSYHHPSNKLKTIIKTSYHHPSNMLKTIIKTSYHHPSNMLKTSYHHPSNKLKTIIKTSYHHPAHNGAGFSWSCITVCLNVLGVWLHGVLFFITFKLYTITNVGRWHTFICPLSAVYICIRRSIGTPVSVTKPSARRFHCFRWLFSITKFSFHISARRFCWCWMFLMV